MHSAHISVTFLPHLTAHLDTRLSSRASTLVAALMLATQPRDARALRRAGGIGCRCLQGNLQAPTPGRADGLLRVTVASGAMSAASHCCNTGPSARYSHLGQ